MPEEHDRERTDPTDDAVTVLRGIWSARGQTSAELDERFGRGGAKACKNMADIGFGGMGADATPDPAAGTNTPVDDGVRSAWRQRLEREGKLRPEGTSIGELARRAPRRS